MVGEKKPVAFLKDMKEYLPNRHILFACLEKKT